MDNLVFVSAHPDIPYFHWQTKVYTYNFIEKGIRPENIHILFLMVDGNKEPSKESLEFKKLGVNVHHYLDNRRDKRYIPSLVPLAMSRWLKDNPHLGQIYFHHDSDIIFRELPNFNNLIYGNTCYLSDTLSYLNYDYIKDCCNRYETAYPQLKENHLLDLMTNIVGIPTEMVKLNNFNSGGAQYLMKNIDYKFWEKVYYDSIRLYNGIYEFDMKYKLNAGGIQIWTAGMWALLWNLWLIGYDTNISDELSFSWATDDLDNFYNHNILHMAGVTDNLKHNTFYKGEYIYVDPIEELRKNSRHFDYISEKSITIKYVEVMKKVLEKENLHIYQ